MIGLVKGTVDTITNSHVFIDTGGVGYKILVTQNILAKAKVGSNLKVYTYTHVREDILELFGFESVADLSLFELLLTVSGVGPKTAIGIFSAGDTKQITNAVLTADVAFFAKVPRLGKKNAQKVILELKGKLGDGDAVLDFAADSEEKEIAAALKDFGFKPDEIHETLKKIRGHEGTVEQKMKLALKQLAK
ncbi:MAG: Holliday junction branch migration protein RuvA [Candidatus Levybacteria bacterium]|nr:Holliday junction branch migration protein RuvA [Candidatus Levybacteria bacterium]